ncbi:MAG: DUF4297 domain-containing protein [Elusimicrobia bacterium]|nr:DUF4297 domain-containing protein [Candidatus Liberimonas magnetica]
MQDNPINKYNHADPGDNVQMCFRYQQGYGVVLLLGSFSGKLPYKSIWCEHYEDFLGERNDGKYDAYQIKTKKPELGAWKLNDKDLLKSIKRFSELEQLASERINAFKFVSNADYYNSLQKIEQCPVKFLEACQKSSGEDSIQTPFKQAFSSMSRKVNCPKELLFRTLKKTDLLKGPGKETFDDEICVTHMESVDALKGCIIYERNKIKDKLIDLIYKASSLHLSDPNKHWIPLNNVPNIDPKLSAKKILIATVALIIEEERITPPFRYLQGSTQIRIGKFKKHESILAKKLTRGGLEIDLESFMQRSLAAEKNLIELGYRNSQNAKEVIDHIAKFVKYECNDSYRLYYDENNIFGPAMYKDIINRIREIASKKSEKVYGLDYECLIGIAGLLTSECHIWWSKKFNLKEEDNVV